jgi:hypothetical protein
LWLIESVVIASGTLLSAHGLIIHGLFSAFQAGNAFFRAIFHRQMPRKCALLHVSCLMITLLPCVVIIVWSHNNTICRQPTCVHN